MAEKSNKASIYEVAKEAGVSIVTVSRVFNDYPHVSKRMRERVFKVAREVGYTPRLVSKPKVISVIIGQFGLLKEGDFKTGLLFHLVREAAQRGVLIEFIPYDKIELATQHLVDGIVEVGLLPEELLQVASVPNVPIVLTNNIRPNENWSTVCTDHIKEVKDITAHLQKAGHQNMCMVMDEDSSWIAEQRIQSWRKQLGDEASVYCLNHINIEDIARQIRDHQHTACVNLTDSYGMPLMNELRNGLGISIPEDLSIICLENPVFSALATPPITTYREPIQDLAEATIEGILAVLNEKVTTFEKMVPGELIVRESVQAV